MAVYAEIDVRNALITAGITPVYLGAPKPYSDAIPAAAVFVQGTYSPAPESYMDGRSQDWRSHRVLVRIRSAPRDYVGGLTTGESVYRALQRAVISGYTRVVCETSCPVSLGLDDKECGEWLIQVLLQGRDTT
jgi:hypothetical protein